MIARPTWRRHPHPVRAPCQLSPISPPALISDVRLRAWRSRPHYDRCSAAGRCGCGDHGRRHGFRSSRTQVRLRLQQVQAFELVQAGENVRTRGMDVKRGHQGSLHRPATAARKTWECSPCWALAHVAVFRRPRAALLSSGDEFAPVDQPLEPGKIRDTNTYTLSALIQMTGSEVLSLGIAPDHSDAIKFLFDQAVDMAADMIISSAGVSVGALDFIKGGCGVGGQPGLLARQHAPGKTAGLRSLPRHLLLSACRAIPFRPS